jgi:hypothetical protein
MAFRFRRAMVAGAAGALLLGAASVGSAWLLGLDLEIVLSSMTVGAIALVLAGMAVSSGAAAFAYALVFEYVTRRAGWRIGAIVGACHGGLLAAGVGLAPWVIEQSRQASASLLIAAPVGAPHAILAVAVIAGAGILFGMIAGGVYGVPRHGPEADTEIWWREVHPTTRRFPRREAVKDSRRLLS